MVFEWPENYDVWSGYLSPINEKTFTIDPGSTETCALEFTAKANTDTISLRLGLKSNGASKGTFSNIRIQDMTATPYPESFVQLNALNSDSLAAQPNRNGYDKNGWYDTVSTDGTIGGTRYTSIASVTGNKTLYAKYTQATYYVTYISTVGTAQKVMPFEYGENPTTAYIPTAEGYKFVGWYSDAGLKAFAPLAVTEPLTLYAKWEPLTYKITFDSNGGICSTADKDVAFNGDYGELPTPEQRTGFVFMGWYDGTDGGNLITENTTLTEAENKTLYALWEHDTFVSGITRSISVKDKFIFGNDIPGMSKEELTAQFSNTNISVSMSTGRMSTGTTLNLVDDLGEVYDTLTVIVFGDVNGDGWYDGMDAVTVNCLANGMLSRNDVTAAQYFAADCNRDGAIDSFDVEILKEAGINKSYDFKECVTKDPKSKSGIRQIPINDILFKLLTEAKAEAKGSFVIEKTRGGRMTEKAWLRLFESYMLALKEKDAEIKKNQMSPKDDEVFEEFTSHQLRHTYCLMLQWSGVDIKIAQELMGHSEYEVTANVYTHTNDDLKKNAAVLQSEFLRNTFMNNQQ